MVVPVSLGVGHERGQLGLAPTWTSISYGVSETGCCDSPKTSITA